MTSFELNEQEIRDQARKDGITHISTGVAIVREGKILLARRAADDFLGGSYELPGGGVDEGETILDGAVREIKEETGLTVSKVLGTFKGFDYAADRKPHVRQINFIVEAASGEVTLDPKEHDDWVMVDRDTAKDVHMSENMRRCVVDAFDVLAI